MAVALGDIFYRAASEWLRLPGNTAATRKFLSQTGTGTVSAVPAWASLLHADLADVWTEVVVSSAEVLALRATPKTLVAAPGAGKVLEFVAAVIILDYNSAAYVEGGDNLGVRYTNTTGVQVSETIEMTGFLDQTGDTLTTARAKLDAIVAKTGCENQALVLHNVGGAEFTTGNSPLRVKTAYRVWSTGW